MYQLVALVFLFSPLVVSSEKCPEFTNLTHPFSVNLYMGKWYEIARTDVIFEKDIDCVTATYTLRRDGNVLVLNEGENLKNGTFAEIVGVAKPTSQNNVLEVQFNPQGPSAPYWIVDTDMVTFSIVVSCVETPQQTYFDGFILSRFNQVFEPFKNILISKLEKVGIPKSKLRMTEQKKCK